MVSTAAAVAEEVLALEVIVSSRTVILLLLFPDLLNDDGLMCVLVGGDRTVGDEDQVRVLVCERET